MRRLLILLILLPSLALADSSIVGGKRVGPVALGQSLQTLEKSLGKADRVQKAEADKEAAMLFCQQKGIAVLVTAKKKVLGITVTSPSYATPEAVRVGSSEKQVRQAYGQGLIRGRGNWTYPDRGLAFSFAKGKVSQIYVMKTEEERPLLGDRLIQAGIRCGDLELGLPFQQVVKLWGKPDHRADMKGKSAEIVSYRDHGVRLVVSQGRVDGILITTGDFITPQGVKIGSSRAEVVRAFGKKFQEKEPYLGYSQDGIGFILGEEQVIEIQVLYPKKASPANS